MTISCSDRTSLFGRRQRVLARACPAGLLARLAAAHGSAFVDSEYSDRVAPPALEGAPAEAARWLSDIAADHHLSSPFVPNRSEFTIHSGARRASRPRREPRFYVGCIASVVVAGRGLVTEHAERDRDLVLDRRHVVPGDVLLQRGWSPLGFAHPRPFLRPAPDTGQVALFRALDNIVASPELAALVRDADPCEVDEAAAGPGAPRPP